jgi:hypothetical protein
MDAAKRNRKRASRPQKRFAPIKVKKGGIIYWRVYLGPRFYGANRIIDRFFRSEEEAKTFFSAELVQRENFGIRGSSLDAQARSDAAEARKLLEAAGIDLKLAQVVRHYLEILRPPGGTKKFANAAAAFQADRELNKRVKSRYLRTLAGQFRTLEKSFGDRLVSTIKALRALACCEKVLLYLNRWQ